MFVPDRPLQPSLALVSKAGAYLTKGPFRFYTLGGYAPDLTLKPKTRLERPARDKRFRLLGPIIGYDENKVLLIQDLLIPKELVNKKM